VSDNLTKLLLINNTITPTYKKLSKQLRETRAG